MTRLIPSERFATGLLDIVERVVGVFGVDGKANTDLRTTLYILLVIGIAFAAGCLVRWGCLGIVKRLLNKHFQTLWQELSDNYVLRNIGRMIPPLVMFTLIPFAFNSDHRGTHVIVLITAIYIILTSVMAINSILSFVWSHYNTYLNNKNLPLRGILDISRGAVWIMAVVVIVALIVNKSPLALLTGLGAFAAVLLLVFKNSILGLVSGIEMADNDMLRVGDWISIPGTDVNGIVMDVSLVVVKVRNWNNTVAMVPSGELISKTFINWRYMKDTGNRQIEMSVPIDASTVRPLSDDELHQLQQRLPLLKDFIDVKMRQRAAGKTANVFNPEAGVNGTIDTNLGLLRAYMLLYLGQHPYLYTDRMLMVRVMQPTATGIPLQIFAYVTTSVWPDYEAVLSDVFEHVIAVAPEFGLSVFQMASERSVYNVGRTPQADTPYGGGSPIYTPTPIPDTNRAPGFK